MPLRPKLSVAATACLALLVSVVPALSDRGQWTPMNQLQDLGGEAIHLTVMPGDGNPYHSRVLWWQNQTIGGVLGWTAGNDGCANYPSSNFTQIGTWNAGQDIFCGGHTQLADGKLLSVGGNELPLLWGRNDARTYSYGPGTDVGTWTPRTGMSEHRWYPTATTLRDGRVLVSSGKKYLQTWNFGGKRDDVLPTSPTGDLMHRHGLLTGGIWDPSITPEAEIPSGVRPPIREGHTAVELYDGNIAQAVFGGKGSGGLVPADVWLLTRWDGGELSAEYRYIWSRLSTSGASPAPRTQHTAVAISSTEMVIFGGLGDSDAVLGDFLHLRKSGSQWIWATVTVNSGMPPSARYGHAAAYDPASRRLFVFGGSTASGQPASDPNVYSFAFSHTSGVASGSWSVLNTTSTSPRPEPRRDHTMVIDPTPSGSLLVYSGNVFHFAGQPGQAVASDTLWRLNLAETPEWTPLECDGTPGPRAGHTAVYENRLWSGRLFIFGGEPAPSQQVDKVVHMIEPFGGAEWQAWGEAPFRLSEHTSALAPGFLEVFSRIPELYNPSDHSWTRLTDSPQLQGRTYPLDFVVPGSATPGGGGRVLAVGQHPQSWYLDIPASGLPGAWSPFTTNGSTGQFNLTGAMYRPGKILIAGGQNISTNALTGMTKTIDVLSSAGWVGRADMVPRSYHNLVVVPTGDVIVFGGVSDATAGSITGPIYGPQLWDANGFAWSSTTDPSTRLAWDSVVRNYHSTSVLLPDGRILTAGGSAGATEKTKARIFCPPYLFKSNGELATRPVINSAPASISWRKVFTVCTANAASVQKVCLIRPAATTHTFDQNQRYVPLDFAVASTGSSRLFVTAPASPDSAPPGYYLLFIVGSGDGADVPSVARWVRLDGPGGLDLCDAVEPAPVTNFAPDLVGSTSIWFTWTGPADDDTLTASGAPTSFALSGSANASVPGPAGTEGSGSVTGLTACSWNYFTVSAWDDNQHESTPVAVSVQTTCGGGGGGEEQSAGGVGLAGEGAGTGTSAPQTSATEHGPENGMLVVETRRGSAGGWQIAMRLQEPPAGFDTSTPTITVEAGDEGGGRDTLGRFEPEAEDNLLGLCSLRDGGRLGIPGVYRLEQVLAHLRVRGLDYVLDDAWHSRLGALGSGGSAVDLAVGDSLTISYSPAADLLSDAASWYALVRRTSAAPPTPMGAGRIPVGEALPTHFALHQNRPNPFRGTTVIAFDMPIESAVRLEVFDLLGRKLVTLADSRYPAGSHVVEWDLRDVNGTRVTPGVYVYRLSAGAYHQRRKMSVLP